MTPQVRHIICLFWLLCVCVCAHRVPYGWQFRLDRRIMHSGFFETLPPRVGARHEWRLLGSRWVFWAVRGEKKLQRHEEFREGALGKAL